ncbi:MAG: tryptophan--tRNA ligase [Burkholderiales bacterium]|nr:tryptophan--tRNA ligase [Burkholderiales bacterium]
MRVLTGITTTGTLHLGNYVGAIRPAIAASKQEDVESFFFMADYHALIKCDDPDRVEASRMQIAATWIAAGLDVERALLYRQSDVPEVCELTWMLTCVTAKGQMNRAHAYKAAVDAAVAAGEEPDSQVTMGLFSYPILMAADILLYNAHRIPVGKDQVQHIEMARDVAQRFNSSYGADFFVLPEAQVDAEMELLPGLDGRKMSKSYDNVVPLFEGGLASLQAAIAKVVTDSRLPGEPKEPEGTAFIQLWDAFASPAERAEMRADLRAGLAWGEAKARVLADVSRRAHRGAIPPSRSARRRRPHPFGEALRAGRSRAHAALERRRRRRLRRRPGDRRVGGVVPRHEHVAAGERRLGSLRLALRARSLLQPRPPIGAARHGTGECASARRAARARDRPALAARPHGRVEPAVRRGAAPTAIEAALATSRARLDLEPRGREQRVGARAHEPPRDACARSAGRRTHDRRLTATGGRPEPRSMSKRAEAPPEIHVSSNVGWSWVGTGTVLALGPGDPSREGWRAYLEGNERRLASKRTISACSPCSGATSATTPSRPTRPTTTSRQTSPVRRITLLENLNLIVRVQLA